MHDGYAYCEIRLLFFYLKSLLRKIIFLRMTKNNEWWRGCVMYQVYPRSYCDANGDGIGDLRGIISKLDYIASLGVDAVWISPFFKSPMKDFGYDVSDYRDVDPIFGSIQDFLELLKEAHRLGLKILIDQVWSHTSDQHRWFKDSRQCRSNHMADWYIWADPQPDGTPPNNWMSYQVGPAWTWDGRRRQYYLHHYIPEQPALNLRNPNVRQEIKNTAAFWLDLGVDGFRVDALHTHIYDKDLRSNPARAGNNFNNSRDVPDSNPMSFQDRIYTVNTPENIVWVEEIREHINKWEGRCLLAEVGGDNTEKDAVDYCQTDKRMHMAYSYGLVKSDMSKKCLTKTIGKVEEIIDDGWMCWSIGNHDIKRVLNRVNPHYADKAALAKYLMALLLSLRGTPCIYQGEELGLPQAELAFEDLVNPFDISLYPDHMGSDGARTPMPWMKTAPNAGFSNTTHKTWLPIPPGHVALAADRQEKDEQSILNEYKRFIAWRKGQDILLTGAFEFVEADGDILAYMRSLDDKKMLCVFNTSDSPASWNYDVDGLEAMEEVNHNASYDGKGFELAPYGYGFFRLTK